MSEEIWKDIPEYEGLYQVSNLGKVKGPSGKMSKLTRCKARRIKEFLWAGISIFALAKQFKVSRSAIQGINNGLTWRDA